jgi:hypothetical protein
MTESVVLWSELLAAEPEFPDPIPGATKFSESQWVWNGVYSALVRINEDLLERTDSGSDLGRIRCAGVVDQSA